MEYIRVFFLFKAECYSTYHIWFIQSFVSGHLGCFSLLSMVNDAAMKLGAQDAVFNGDGNSLSECAMA